MVWVAIKREERAAAGTLPSYTFHLFYSWAGIHSLFNKFKLARIGVPIFGHWNLQNSGECLSLQVASLAVHIASLFCF